MLVGNNSQPIAVGVNPEYAVGARSGAGFVTTTGVTATPMGGTGPYTYLWTRADGDASIAISSTTVRNPTWSGTVTLGDSKNADWQVVATDAFGNSSPPSNLIPVYLSEISFV